MERQLSRVALVALVLAAVFAGSAQAQPGASDRALAVVATAASVQIRCYSSMDEYFAQTKLPTVRYWLGIAGFWGVPQSEWASNQPTPVVGLTANACLAASRLSEGVTIPRAYAAFTLAHELAHASGIGDETEADCRGAALLPKVAGELGLRGTAAFAALERAARRSSGYAEIPAPCWRGLG
ncbi:MAG: hypothetical protein JWM06_2799 [Actinomycetia bacterium]|jgi:hypothetical protein|nr:hypothetical protein [Actinomycetes bacterium]